jgi:hypothetical protein
MQILELKRLDPEGRTVEKVPGVRMTENGLVFDRPLTIEQWKEVGQMLKKAQKATLWWQADWMEYGKRSYDETEFDQAVGQLEFDFVGNKFDLLINLAAVPLERRRPGLSAQHYLFLTKLPTIKEQDKWAKVAEVEKLTPMDLKRSIAQGEVVRGSEERQGGVNTIQEVVRSFLQWQRQVQALDPLETWSGDKHKELYEEIKPIVSLVDFLENQLVGSRKNQDCVKTEIGS